MQLSWHTCCATRRRHWQAARLQAHHATQVPLRREKPFMHASAATPDALNTQLLAPAGQALQAAGLAVSSTLYPSSLQWRQARKCGTR